MEDLLARPDEPLGRFSNRCAPGQKLSESYDPDLYGGGPIRGETEKEVSGGLVLVQGARQSGDECCKDAKCQWQPIGFMMDEIPYRQ